MPNRDIQKTFLTWLESRAAEVRRLEQEASDKIGRGESDAYRADMRRKAELLAALPADALIPLASLTPEIRNEIEGHLQRFAQSAANALSLNSVFYMSALLYPEKHHAGEPNDLEILLEMLRARSSRG